MNNRERENATLSFNEILDRGSVEETFHPWDLTINRWKNEGIPAFISEKMFINGDVTMREEKFLDCSMTEEIYKYEHFLGFDGVKRVSFWLPLRIFNDKVLVETDEYIVKQDIDGWNRKYYKNSSLVKDIKPVVINEKDWHILKEMSYSVIDQYYTDENIQSIYGIYKSGHEKGDYTIRMNITGFFWTPRELLGIEGHMLSFYDYPEMLHDINEFILNIYIDKLGKVLDVLPADVLYLMEDLSGVNGPMLSPELFDEFVGSYYERLIPFLKQKGVKNVFVDTDGDFNKLIPNFIESGIDGFLPMDVNAGMDIVAVRQEYPKLKFIGAFNKLEIAKGKDAIDKEFERLLPVIRQGGYIPGCDHQVVPSTPFENYKYYTDHLKKVMKEACKGIR